MEEGNSHRARRRRCERTVIRRNTRRLDPSSAWDLAWGNTGKVVSFKKKGRKKTHYIGKNRWEWGESVGKGENIGGRGKWTDLDLEENYMIRFDARGVKGI